MDEPHSASGPGQTRRTDGATLRIRVIFGSAGMVGPGKAELLEQIRETGSIAAAGRQMGMSYRRAWALVETLNGMFREPVVDRTRGGARGGGARVTATGLAVIDAYREIERGAALAAEAQMARLAGLLRETPGAPDGLHEGAPDGVPEGTTRAE